MEQKKMGGGAEQRAHAELHTDKGTNQEKTA